MPFPESAHTTPSPYAQGAVARGDVTFRVPGVFHGPVADIVGESLPQMNSDGGIRLRY